MFAKLAQIGHFGRTHSAGFSSRPCNDNLQLRLVASPRPRKTRLTCRWQKAASGALECVWGAEGADATGAATEPQLCRLNQLLLRALPAAA